MGIGEIIALTFSITGFVLAIPSFIIAIKSLLNSKKEKKYKETLDNEITSLKRENNTIQSEIAESNKKMALYFKELLNLKREELGYTSSSEEAQKEFFSDDKDLKKTFNDSKNLANIVSEKSKRSSFHNKSNEIKNKSKKEKAKQTKSN